MSTRRFCDACDAPILSEDDKPFIRFHANADIKAVVLITNQNNDRLTDICNECKMATVKEGLEEPPRLPLPESASNIAGSEMPSLNTRPATGGGGGSKPVYVPSLHPSPPEANSSQPQPKEEQG